MTKPLIGSHGDDSDIITYKSFVDAAYPYTTLKNKQLDAAGVKDYNRCSRLQQVFLYPRSSDPCLRRRKQKKQRTTLQSAFTSEGAPGEVFRPFLDQVMERLHFPEDAKQVAQVEKNLFAPLRLLLSCVTSTDLLPLSGIRSSDIGKTCRVLRCRPVSCPFQLMALSHYLFIPEGRA